MIKAVHHVAISTRNLTRLREFYCGVLGFEPVMEAEWKPGTEEGARADHAINLKNSAAKAAMVKKGDVIMELFEYSSPEPKPIPSDWKVCDHGYTHIALLVDDLDGEYERLKKAGMTFHAPPGEGVSGMRGLYGHDPEGHVIEILEISEVV
jgi:catechol 2,3-dioxygenase-like lactoylglutathione lyase family enzyme